MMRVELPETDTEIRFNVSGKTIEEIAEELTEAANILREILNTDGTFVDGYAIKFHTAEAASAVPHPMPQLHYKTWDEDGPVYGGPIVMGYLQEGAKLNIEIAPDFMAWARTNRPLDEFCKKQIEEIRGALEEEQR